MLELYHGSSKIVEKVMFGYGRTDNDYGQGFYLTRDSELAREWACVSKQGGFLNMYQLDDTGLSVLNLTDGSWHILHWLTLLLANRIVRLSSPVQRNGKEYLLEHFLPDTSHADVITGYRADDSYFSYARAFLNNTITVSQLEYAMKLGDLGEQYVLKSSLAFDRLRYVKCEPVDGRVYYPKRVRRDRKAREDFYQSLDENDMTGLYLMDLIRREVTADDLFLS